MTQIALIAGRYQPDRCGVAHYTDHLRQALAARGLESIVLTTYDAAQTTYDNTVKGVVRDWHLRHLVSLVRAIHATEIDLLHIQHAAGTYGFDRSIFLLPLLLRLTGWQKPIVTTVHEYGWWEWQPPFIPTGLLEWLKTWGQQHGWWDREDGFLLTLSDALITTNPNAEEVIQARLPHLVQRLQRIPIAANVEVAPISRSVARQKLLQHCGWAEEAVILVFFGFLHPVKGLETLLPAFQKVLANYPQARLLLLGGVESLALNRVEADRYWQQLHQAIADLQLQDKVHLTGYLEAEAASHCLSGCDIGVLPFNHGVTLKSGSLLALMAHGLSIVATRSTPADIELEAEPILRLVTPRQVNELAEELIYLTGNPVLRQQLGTAGQTFSRRFSWAEIATAHLEIYRTVLAEAPLATARSMA